MIFYTADLHFHYEPFLPSRPFDTVEDMDRQLIHRWNEAVSEEDTVYVVGDVGYNRGLVPGDALSRLRGHKHLIRGNHDTGFENAGELYRYFETVTDFNEIDDGDTHIILCHYPILYRKRGYMVHGHLHQTRGPEYDILRQLPRMLNAGVDVNFYRPVTLSQLIENNRAFYSGAHDALIPPPPPPGGAAHVFGPAQPQFVHQSRAARQSAQARRRGGDGWLPGQPDFRPLPPRPDFDKE